METVLNFFSVQMVVIMKKLTSAAILSPSEAAEEFREGIIKCFRAMISGLLPCFDDSCSCKRTVGWPQLSDRRDYQTQVSESYKYDFENRECLLAFLQSQSALAAVGHWLSILLKVILFSPMLSFFFHLESCSYIHSKVYRF